MAHLHCNLPPDTRILTIGRKPWSREEYITEFMEAKAKPFIEKKAFDAAAWDKFLALFEYVRMDVDSVEDYQRLKETSREGVRRVFYLATSPDLFTNICDNLSAAGLIDGNSRVVLEKPLATIWPPRRRSTRRSASISAKRRSTGSTTTWARKPCRT